MQRREESDELTRIPPHDIDIERSILSGIIYSSDYEAFNFLRPENFYKTAHAKIYQHCQKVYSSELAVDPRLLASSFSDISEIGGVSYLASLADDPPPTNSEAFCRKLVALYQLRRLIEISNATTKRAFSSRADEVGQVLQYLTAEVVKLSMGSASSDWVKLSEIIPECIDRAERAHKKQGITGVPSGFADIDTLTAGFQPGDLILLAARPGCGKTAFAVNSSIKSSKAGFKNAFQSLEMGRTSIGNRYLSIVSRVNLLKFRSGMFTDSDWEKLGSSAEELFHSPIWIDDRPRANTMDIARGARGLKMREGLDILWIDYLGFIDGDKSSRSKVQEIESISRAMKELAKELLIPVVLICQLNRECEKRENKRPILSDLRDSGALEQDADLVLFLYRDSKYNQHSQDQGVIECEIAKQRNGPEGLVRLCWTEDFARFDNLERHHTEGPPDNYRPVLHDEED